MTAERIENVEYSLTRNGAFTLIEALVRECSDGEAELALSRGRLYDAIRKAYAGKTLTGPEIVNLTGLSKQRISQIVKGGRQ